MYPGGAPIKPRDRVLLLILAHVDADHRVLVVEEELGERARQLGLADPGRSEKDERAERAIRVLQTGARAPNRVRDRDDRFVLADDALVQTRFHAQQLLDFAFHQAADGNARPLADDFGDVFFVDFFFQHPLCLLQRCEPMLLLLDLALELRHAAVLQLRRFRIVAETLRALDFELHLLELFLQLARALNGVLFLLPMRAQLVLLLLQIGELFLELPRRSCDGLSVSLRSASRSISSCMMRRCTSSSSAGIESISIRSSRRRFVHQIDRLVGQESIGDVAVRQHRGRHQRRVLQLRRRGGSRSVRAVRGGC